MGRIVVTEFVSLDGVIEDPGGAEDFKYGGWSFEYDRGDDGNKFKLDETMASEALLLGRRTYEGFAGAWPSREGEFADKFNNMPKYVVSSSPSIWPASSPRSRRSTTATSWCTAAHGSCRACSSRTSSTSCGS
jgi:dihydrofolate reductase